MSYMEGRLEEGFFSPLSGTCCYEIGEREKRTSEITRPAQSELHIFLKSRLSKHGIRRDIRMGSAKVFYLFLIRLISIIKCC